MSKSYGNTILLSEPEAEVRAKLKTMVTDPARVRRTIREIRMCVRCSICTRCFPPKRRRQKAAEGCTTAGIGCIQCKGWLADGCGARAGADPERRAHFEANPDEVDAILDDGSIPRQWARSGNDATGTYRSRVSSS